jgi:hypothetical protein
MRMKKLVFLSIGMLAFALQTATAQILWTTYEDYTNWTGDGALATTAFDHDGVTVNGLGNEANPGGAGTAGSLQLNAVTSGWSGWLAGSGGEAWMAGFLAAVDGPGAIPAYSAQSGYGPGTLVAASGTLTLTYTMPDSTFGGTYFEPGLTFNYNGTWQPFWPSSQTDLGPVTTPNGTMEMWEAYIPYNINAVNAGLTYFTVGIAQNTDFTGANPWYVDQIAVIPEPATMALFGVGLTGLMLIHRRRQS